MRYEYATGIARRTVILGLLGTLYVWSQPPALNLRLDTPLTSYKTKPGDSFRAIVAAPWEQDGRVVIPAGATIHGTVRRAKGIGLGFARERAAIDLDFNEYELADGRRIPIQARLLSVDNARETVNADGRIKGILAASNPQSFISGVWYLPRANMFQRALMGLTGASGRIWTQFSMGPIGAAVLFGVRIAAFRMPEPEIRLPVGTELKVELTGLPPYAPSFEASHPATRTGALADWIATRGFTVHKPGGLLVDDIVNVFFLGSREQLVSAFTSAGWTQPETLNRHSAGRFYKAYASGAGYSTAPVSRLLYANTEPELVFQKSFNTLARRHHVRIWRTEVAGREVWFGAATEDIGIAFNRSSMLFTHRIARAVDEERAKIVADLDFAGCTADVSFVDRPAAVNHDPAGKEIATDGRAAVLSLAPCERTVSAMVMPRLPGSTSTRAVRRTVLEVRHYFLRGNAYYWAFRGLQQLHNSYEERSVSQSTPVSAYIRPTPGTAASLRASEERTVAQSVP